MTSEEIVAVAQELNCGPSETAVSFARMIAEHCAQLAEEMDGPASGMAIAGVIRKSFMLGA
jgi:hypothetical protein